MLHVRKELLTIKVVLLLIVLNVESIKLQDVLHAGEMQPPTLALIADLKDLTKMGKAIITFKMMPKSVDVDLEPIKEKALVIAREHNSIGEMQAKIEPIAFGLKAVLVLAMYEVEGADFEAIANKMGELEGVQSSEVAKMDLALG